MRFMEQFRRSDSGASALEFALVFPVFATMMFGTVQIGLAYYFAGSVQFALEKTARLTMVDQDMNSGQAQTAFNNALEGYMNDPVSLSYWVDNSGPVPIAHLSATYVHNFVIPFVPSFNVAFPVETRVPLSP